MNRYHIIKIQIDQFHDLGQIYFQREINREYYDGFDDLQEAKNLYKLKKDNGTQCILIDSVENKLLDP